MMTRDLNDQPTWNTALRLPMVTDDSALFDFQILLGGISLVLSRLHPVFAKNRFTSTRGLALKLTRVLACDDLAQCKLTSAHLSQAMAECDRALDPGTLIVFRRLLAQTVRQEQASCACAQPAHAEPDDFTYSDFLAREQLSSACEGRQAMPQAASGLPLN